MGFSRLLSSVRFSRLYISNIALKDCTDLQQQQPQLYQDITKHLNPEEQQVIQSAVAQADQIAQQADATPQAGAPQLNGSR